jgi:hypothetical protein
VLPSQINVLIACEASGATREAFRRLGFNAWSCDLLPADDGSPYHLLGDVRQWLDSRWHLVIAHPDCTFLTISAAWAYGDGPYHQRVKPGTLVGAARRAAREEALTFVQTIMSAPILFKAIENPVGAIGTRIRPASQYIQPNEYGEDASKKTGLWLENLPLLERTKDYPPRIVEWPKGSGKQVKRWGNQTDSGQNNITPGTDRWRTRSKTYQGWADAFAAQWGSYILEYYSDNAAGE